MKPRWLRAPASRRACHLWSWDQQPGSPLWAEWLAAGYSTASRYVRSASRCAVVVGGSIVAALGGAAIIRPPPLLSYAACFGITIGGSDVYFVASAAPPLPGGEGLAYSYSAWYFCEILTLLLAGPAAGRIFDLTGNYDRTLALLAGSALLALILSLLILRPRAQREMPSAPTAGG